MFLVLLRTEGDVVLGDMCAYVCTLSCCCMKDISLTYFPIGGRTDAARWLNVAEWAGLVPAVRGS